MWDKAPVATSISVRFVPLAVDSYTCAKIRPPMAIPLPMPPRCTPFTLWECVEGQTSIDEETHKHEALMRGAHENKSEMSEVRMLLNHARLEERWKLMNPAHKMALGSQRRIITA